MKIKLGMRKPRKWKWMPFVNPARTDNATFYHWRRPSDDPKDYPFAKFNKVLILSKTFNKFKSNEYILESRHSIIHRPRVQ